MDAAREVRAVTLSWEVGGMRAELVGFRNPREGTMRPMGIMDVPGYVERFREHGPRGVAFFLETRDGRRTPWSEA